MLDTPSQPIKVLSNTQYYPIMENIGQYPIPQCQYRSNPISQIYLWSRSRTVHVNVALQHLRMQICDDDFICMAASWLD